MPGDPLLNIDPLSMTYPTPEHISQGETNPASDFSPILQPTPVQWDGTKRVTVLLLGLDYRDWQAGETPRSDSMILMTVDPLSKTAGMLSIPRDMWTIIPGYDYYKINTAYFIGESRNLPGEVRSLPGETVENFLGVPIDYSPRLISILLFNLSMLWAAWI